MPDNRAKPHTRIVATDDGGSTFEDSRLDLAEQHVASGTPPMLVAGVPSSDGVMFLRSLGFSSEPHPVPREQWLLMLRGTIEVEVTDGSRRQFTPGDVIHVADTTGRGHVSTAIGEPPFECLLIPVAG
jgi:hypothetical protein